MHTRHRRLRRPRAHVGQRGFAARGGRGTVTEAGTMRQPIRGEMPILLSLPLRFARRPRRRRHRARGALILLTVAIVIALLAST
jgi:hypothetical protein